MAKDSGGHGSEARGEKVAMGQAVDERHFPTRSPQDLAAARLLGQGHPKSDQVATHPAMLAARNAEWAKELDRMNRSPAGNYSGRSGNTYQGS